MELLSDSGAIVGFANIDNSIKTGMELNGSKLFPSEVVVRITEARDESQWTGEVVGEVLGLCVGLIIRWNRSLARVVHNSSNTLKSQCEVGLRTPTLQTRATIFDFHNQFNSPGSNERAQRSSHASNPLDENLSFSQPISNNIRDLPHAEGFTYVRPTRRPYSMQSRTSEGRSSDLAPLKVSLESVHNAIPEEDAKGIV